MANGRVSVSEETFLYRKERFNLFWFRSDRGGREKRRKVRLEGDEASTCKQVGSGLARHPGDGRTGGSGRFGFGDLLGFM